MTHFTLRSNLGKSKHYYFLALWLKVAKSIQLNELMKLSEYQRSRSFFDLGKGHSDFKIKTGFSQKQLGNSKPKLIRMLKVELV